MAALGYVSDGEAAKHDHYSKEDLHVEMHKELLPAESRGYSYFQDVWKRVEKQRGKKYCCQMKAEDHYIYTLYHLIEHFIRGGIGIRMILDLYILNQQPELNREKVEIILKKLGVDKFNSYICKIGQIWFDDTYSISKTEQDSLKELEEYIVNGGVFGNTQNNNINRTVMYKTKWKFFIQVSFPSYKTMQTVFPWLKSPFLLPYAWVRRWGNAWTKRRGNVSGQLIRMLEMETNDKNKIKQRQQFFQKYGLF